METRTAVAANPNEMALALVEESAPLMDEAAAAAASPLATAAAGSDAVPEPAIPTHGLDICPANPLIFTSAQLLLLLPATATARGSWLPIREHRAPPVLARQKKCRRQRQLRTRGRLISWP